LDLSRLGLDIFLGSVSGGVTSWVAVVMIFRPYERTFGLHGAIPKNKSRLAKTIGKTVGERLLTPADIIEELHRSGLRDAIEAKLAEVAVDALDRDRGPLRELLPPAVVAEIERMISEAGPDAAEAYERYVATSEFEEQVRAFVARSRKDAPKDATKDAPNDATKDAPPDDTGTALTPERRTGIAGKAAGIASGLIDDVIVKWALRAARSERARAMAAEAVRGAGVALLDRPLGRLGRWLPDDASHRLVALAAPAVWEQIIEKLPALLETVDIPAMVERKVLGFSTQRVEDLVRGVTQRELNLIVQLGYVLGGAIGAAQFAVETWVRG
jgi:uncharacterized membrane protein YheB (UPF0754 family)